MRKLSSRHRWGTVGLLVPVALAVTVAVGGSSASGADPTAKPAAGISSLTVANVSSPWPSLGPPPAKWSAAFVVNYMNAIYGELFRRNTNGEVIPGLAQSWDYSKSDRSLIIHLRKNVKFSDGTPFNAEAVRQHLHNSLLPANQCQCLGAFVNVERVTTKGNYDVVLTLKQKDTTLPQQFVSQAPNWVPSPTALKKMGAAAFGQAPVGAGPYKVVSNVASSKLVLKANPLYWDKGKPYIKNLTFVNAATDQTAYADLQAGSVQLVMGMTNPQILAQAKSKFQTEQHKGVVVYMIEFNTDKAPFNNDKARQAVAYATNPQQVLNVVSPGFGAVTQSPVGPGGTMYLAKVPGARTYNLAKAKQIVQKMGGLSFKFSYITTTALYPLGAQALAQQWRAAGIDVKLNPVALATYQQDLLNRSWDSVFTVEGGADPSVGVSSSLPEKYGLVGQQTCCHDITLAKKLHLLGETRDPAKRQARAFDLYHYISAKQYSVPLFSLPTVLVGVKGLNGLDPAPNGSAGKELVPWDTLK
ncbi:MAG TPA: ABC transporter substrate-binding protein [Solirubrobacteraceae bacterium]|nr:ABC transporter substrate-binding protein [Solirubrobacteraceae bacterium]